MPIADLVLILAAFVTSIVSGIAGLGGGTILLTLMPGFVPNSAIIPIHGATQLSSNLSRAIFSIKNISWGIVIQFLCGSIIGAWIASFLVSDFPFEYLELVLGISILILIWAPLKKINFQSEIQYYILGSTQTFLTMFLGSSVPLIAPFLSRAKLNKEQMVSTLASLAAVTHIAKVVTFLILGFSFVPYFSLTTGLILSAILGSFIGTKVRVKINEELFKKAFKIIITILAFKLILTSL